MDETKKLLDFYDKKKGMIRSFVKSCSVKDNECLFGELCFCIMTPQSRAKNCREAVNRLKADNKLFTADLKELRGYLKGIRFPEVKAQRIIEARDKLPELKQRLDSNPTELREWLKENIKGLGMKESAHFMRNIGFKGMAIIDVHIQNFLKKVGVIEQDKSLTKKRYMELEKKFLELADKLKIPAEELDIAIWLYQSGEKDFYG
ncbi:MAG: N-glycosylase [Candidatus Aenigmatarchaeota archaeon]